MEEVASPVARPAHLPLAVEKTRRATRLQDDWTLPEEWASWAREKRPGLDLDDLAESFRDYWHARAGKEGVKLDWYATWRGWVRRERTGSAAPPRGREVQPDFTEMV